jgi:glycosyltransferase involved in cell wall biosynthesis
MLPWMISARFAWDAFKLSDACIANTEWEAHLMRYVFGAPPEKVHVVPNGVEDVFLKSEPAPRGKWLVCPGVITERKRMVETAEAAVRAKTPLWVIGEPYAQEDPYYKRFLAILRQNNGTVRYEGGVRDRGHLARIYREARGFVLLSTKETRSLASEEAAACECRLLLSELPWARSVFGQNASYCPVTAQVERTAEILRRFYEAAPDLPPPPKPMSWADVGKKFKAVYEAILKAPMT